MIEGSSVLDPVFLNTVGHILGVVLFGLFTVLLLRSGNAPDSRQRAASVVASCLALAWNVGSLIGLAFLERDGGVEEWLVAINFSALSLLPAVLFAVLLKRNSRYLIRLGYAVSALSAVLHFWELRPHSGRLHEASLLLVSIGFGVLGTAALLEIRHSSRPIQEKRASTIDVVCLMLFTFSFLHFGFGHSRTAWTSEVAWHHASIPLVLMVLLREYRQLMAEAFIRFLANVGLAGVFGAGLYCVLEALKHVLPVRGNAFIAAILAVALCFSLVLFSYIRAGLQKKLTRYVFGRGDLNRCSASILQASSECETEQQFLERASKVIADFVEAERSELVEGEVHVSGGISRPLRRAEIGVPLVFSRGDGRTLLLGRRAGGKRYLAEDIASLRSLAGVVVQQVERFRANQLQHLAQEAELRALRAQVNPHFLFNALNTLYGTIHRESMVARRLVLNLAELFRYCLQRDRELIPLGEELEIVQAYLEIESLRLGDRFKFEIAATDSARNAKIPALLVQPLVENAIKHGISKVKWSGRVQLVAEDVEGMLTISVSDNGPGFDPARSTSGIGMGLENVRQRLKLGCAAGSDLKIDSSVSGCTVTVRVAQRPRGRPDRSQTFPVHSTAQPVRRL